MELDNTKYPNTRGSPEMRQSNAAVPLQGSRMSIYKYIYIYIYKINLIFLTT